MTRRTRKTIAGTSGPLVIFQASHKRGPGSISSRAPLSYLHFIGGEVEASGRKLLAQGHSATKWISDPEQRLLTPVRLSPARGMATLVHFTVMLFKGNPPRCIWGIFNFNFLQPCNPSPNQYLKSRLWKTKSKPNRSDRTSPGARENPFWGHHIKPLALC